MNFKKAAIVMTIIPAMFLTACNESQQSTSPTPDTQQQAIDTANAINKSYDEAKANGYTGTLEDWVKLVELNQTNPQAAKEAAAAAGYSGFDMLMAGAMGMMLGNMLSNSSSMNSYRNSGYYDRDRRSYSSGSAPVARKYTAPKTSSYSSSSATRSSSSVSRGGFGGAVSSGG